MSAGVLDGGESGLQPGFHGKVPTKGDFITRRLPRSFVDPWDSWMQSAINCSKEQLGDDWLSIYLTSPLWRFVLSPGLCGDAAVAGVLMPSVDRVGRYFPFTLAVALPGCGNAAAVPVSGEPWFTRVEELVLTALDDDFDLDRFDAQIIEFGAPDYGRRAAGGAAIGLDAAANGLRVGLDVPLAVAGDYPALVDRLLQAAYPGYSLWWTAGSEDMAASLVTCGGLPRIGSFVALLDGRWREWGWADPAAGQAPG